MYIETIQICMLKVNVTQEHFLNNTLVDDLDNTFDSQKLILKQFNIDVSNIKRSCHEQDQPKHHKGQGNTVTRIPKLLIVL
jgi:hypothetical protein